MGGLGDLFEKITIGDGASVAGLTFKIQRNFIAVACRNVPVHAVHCNIELAVLKPASLWTPLRLRIGVGPGMDGVKRSIPIQALCRSLPVGHSVRLIDLFSACISPEIGRASCRKE